LAKETFHRLSEEKRTRFLEVAHREFALYDYDQASVSRIVAELGIAKGSIYQYFEDKEDLYLFLLERAIGEKLEYIRRSVEGEGANESGGFFETHRRVMIAGSKFDLTYPRLSLIIYRAMQSSRTGGHSGLADELVARSGAFLREFLELAAEQHEIRTDIDLDLAVHIVNTLTLALEPYLKIRYGYSRLSQIIDPDSRITFTDDELEAVVTDLVDVMRSGLAPDENEARSPKRARWTGARVSRV